MASIIKRRLYKTYTYSRKSPNKSITLEELGLNEKYSSIDEFVNKISNAYISCVDIAFFTKIMKWINVNSDRMILSQNQLIVVLKEMLIDLLKTYCANGDDYGLYRGEYFSLLLTTNRNNKHIIVILPNFDVI